MSLIKETFESYSTDFLIDVLIKYRGNYEKDVVPVVKEILIERGLHPVLIDITDAQFKRNKNPLYRLNQWWRSQDMDQRYQFILAAIVVVLSVAGTILEKHHLL
ncbi:hypothetical protein [Mucilaginibacter sp.]|uniref:hypothetical protein n=1 Tax=Mucilaginibacter sp. TaxID=1882438 RepID=UPI0025D86343|nr:hypothetical protein [Mucilaginibacter sp.]